MGNVSKTLYIHFQTEESNKCFGQCKGTTEFVVVFAKSQSFAGDSTQTFSHFTQEDI